MQCSGQGQPAGGNPVERFHLPDHHAGAAFAQGGFHCRQGGVAVVRADQHQPARIQAKAAQAVRIQIRAGGDPEDRPVAADPPGQGSGEPGRQDAGFAVHANAADFMQLAERQPAAGQMRVDPWIAEGQNAEGGRSDVVTQGGQMRRQCRREFRHPNADRMGRIGGEGGNVQIWPDGKTGKGKGVGHGVFPICSYNQGTSQGLKSACPWRHLFAPPREVFVYQALQAAHGRSILFPFKTGERGRMSEHGEVTGGATWPDELYDLLRANGVTQFAYVPDAGHKVLINRSLADPEVHSISLTTEEEGVALAAGADLGGGRSVLLMQSSGVGNCINMLSLTVGGRFPFLTFVSMRGDFGEGNPWQFQMGQATQKVLEAMGVIVVRANEPQEVIEVAAAAITMAFQSGMAVAVLLSQRLIGAKKF